jgi:hypothetical protein
MCVCSEGQSAAIYFKRAREACCVQHSRFVALSILSPKIVHSPLSSIQTHSP